MKDRIEHTEHKRRDREATDTRFGDRRYGGPAAERPDVDERPDSRP